RSRGHVRNPGADPSRQDGSALRRRGRLRRADGRRRRRADRRADGVCKEPRPGVADRRRSARRRRDGGGNRQGRSRRRAQDDVRVVQRHRGRAAARRGAVRDGRSRAGAVRDEGGSAAGTVRVRRRAAPLGPRITRITRKCRRATDYTDHPAHTQAPDYTAHTEYTQATKDTKHTEYTQATEYTEHTEYTQATEHTEYELPRNRWNGRSTLSAGAAGDAAPAPRWLLNQTSASTSCGSSCGRSGISTPASIGSYSAARPGLAAPSGSRSARAFASDCWAARCSGRRRRA